MRGDRPGTGQANRFSQGLRHLTFPPTVHKHSSFFASLLFFFFFFFDSNLPLGDAALSLCSSDLHFPDD